MAAVFNLCTALDVNRRLDTGPLQTKDTIALQQIIPAVSSDIEDYLRRWITKTDHTEVFDVNDSLTYFLKGYPVASITDVRFATDWDFDTASVVATAAYCSTANSLKSGILRFKSGYYWNGVQALEVNYNGGIATDYADLDSSNEGRLLKECAILEAGYRVRTRHTIGAESEYAGDAGNVSWQRGERFLREVERKLKPLRKVR